MKELSKIKEYWSLKQKLKKCHFSFLITNNRFSHNLSSNLNSILTISNPDRDSNNGSFGCYFFEFTNYNSFVKYTVEYYQTCGFLAGLVRTKGGSEFRFLSPPTVSTHQWFAFSYLKDYNRINPEPKISFLKSLLLRII